jgi:hypothetical protein
MSAISDQNGGGPNAELTQPADHETNQPETHRLLERMYHDNFVRLGGSSIPVHLEDDDYTTAWRMAVDCYRQMGSGSVYKAWTVIHTTPAVQEYVMDEMVDNVIKIWRGRGLFGGQTAGAGAFESFGAATANTLLRGGIGQNGAAFDLVSYDLVLQYQETLDRLFAREMQFVFRTEANTLYLLQVPHAPEEILVESMVLKSYIELLKDHFAARWLRDYHLAEMKIILGEKYRVFATIPGAQGGTTMKGEQLVSEGIQDKQRLEDDLLLYVDGGMVPQPIRG